MTAQATKSGDPTELALLHAAVALGVPADRHAVERLTQFHFNPTLRRMSTIDRTPDGIRLHCEGAPEELLPLCTRIATDAGGARPLAQAERDAAGSIVDSWADQGLRILAIAERDLTSHEDPGLPRENAERDMTLLGLVAMFDPPRPEVPDAVARCHTAGIRLIIVTATTASPPG